MALEEVRVPDIGDFDAVEIIEVLVGPGDTVAEEDSLITLESDKASMEIPSPAAGTVKELKVQVGNQVSQGDLILVLEGEADAARAAPAGAAPTAEAGSEAGSEADDAAGGGETSAAPAPSGGGSAEIRVPDIGDFDAVEVIEVLVGAGDEVRAEDSLITLESDKASMEIPSPRAGRVEKVHVEVGDKVSEGDLIATLTGGDTTAARDDSAEDPSARSEPPAPAPPPASTAPAAAVAEPSPRQSPTAHISEAAFKKAHASPAVRRFARELGADLGLVPGSGTKGRILREDVKAFVKQAMAGAFVGRGAAPGAGGMGIPALPEVDFGKWGEIETQDLKRIKKISGAHLHRAWLNVPHVTHHDEADVTELEAFRKSLKDEAGQRGVRVTALAFIIKAVAGALRQFPQFNASLTPDLQSLVLKKYCHIGIAVDTPNGLVVPVFRDVDRKSVYRLAEEMADLSARAREGKLKPDEMQGGCMSISSLGGIGGTAFTPIVNAPEVAILGVTRSRMTPVWDGREFVPRLMLPLDLSYDHRVIDGAEAARFMNWVCQALGDLRRLLL